MERFVFDDAIPEDRAGFSSLVRLIVLAFFVFIITAAIMPSLSVSLKIPPDMVMPLSVVVTGLVVIVLFFGGFGILATRINKECIQEYDPRTGKVHVTIPKKQIVLLEVKYITQLGRGFFPHTSCKLKITARNGRKHSLSVKNSTNSQKRLKS